MTMNGQQGSNQRQTHPQISLSERGSVTTEAATGLIMMNESPSSPSSFFPSHPHNELAVQSGVSTTKKDEKPKESTPPSSHITAKNDDEGNDSGKLHPSQQQQQHHHGLRQHMRERLYELLMSRSNIQQNQQSMNTVNAGVNTIEALLFRSVRGGKNHEERYSELLQDQDAISSELKMIGTQVLLRKLQKKQSKFGFRDKIVFRGMTIAKMNHEDSRQLRSMMLIASTASTTRRTDDNNDADNLLGMTICCPMTEQQYRHEEDEDSQMRENLGFSSDPIDDEDLFDIETSK